MWFEGEYGFEGRGVEKDKGVVFVVHLMIFNIFVAIS